MFNKLSPKAKWQLGTALLVAAAFIFATALLCYFDFVTIIFLTGELIVVAIWVAILLFIAGAFSILQACFIYRKQIYDEGKILFRNIVIAIFMGVFLISVIASIAIPIAISITESPSQHLIAYSYYSLAIGLIFAFISIWFMLKWDTRKQNQTVYFDILTYSNLSELKSAFNRHYSAEGYQNSHYATSQNSEYITYYFKNIDNKYIDIILICDIPLVDEEISNELDITYSDIENSCRELLQIKNTRKTIILSTKTIDERFHRYFRENIYHSSPAYIETIFIAGLSFSERKVYIKKMLDGSGLQIYKKMLFDFCTHMHIKTPDFWGNRNKTNMI